VLKYENMNMKRPKQGYGSKSNFRLMLNILKVIGGRGGGGGLPLNIDCCLQLVELLWHATIVCD